MAIDLNAILYIAGFAALRLGIPILIMVLLCKLIPWCFPAPTDTTDTIDTIEK